MTKLAEIILDATPMALTEAVVTVTEGMQIELYNANHNKSIYYTENVTEPTNTTFYKKLLPSKGVIIRKSSQEIYLKSEIGAAKLIVSKDVLALMPITYQTVDGDTGTFMVLEA